MPSRVVRTLAFNAFARMVRRRHTVTAIDGLWFDLDLGETIDLSIYLRQYEPEVTAAIHRYTRPGATVIDVGANIGAHTLLFAKLAGKEGRVIAFEPTDYAFAKLARNIALNDLPQIEAVKLALADHREGPHRVNFRSSWPTDGKRKDGESTVAFERLDAWCEEHRVGRVDLMKIDIDGHEFPFIGGAQGTIMRHMPVMLMEAAGPNFDDPSRNPYRLLAEWGYRFLELKGGREMTIEAMRDRLPRHDTELTVTFNVLAVPSAGGPPIQ